MRLVTVKPKKSSTTSLKKMLLLSGITATLIITAAPASLLGQSSSATDLTNTEGSVGSSNNNSNVTLGNLFYSTQQPIEETVNPINETYIEISYMDRVALMPPNATGVVINATERGNFTVTILPNGLSVNQGQSLITTEDGGGQEESVTSTFVSLGRVGPDGTGSHTGAEFFSTNSTGQLAFLDNMVGIAQVKISPEGTTVNIWEWKGGTLPFENGIDGGSASAMENQTSTIPVS
jgi:hypothetical protein